MTWNIEEFRAYYNAMKTFIRHIGRKHREIEYNRIVC